MYSTGISRVAPSVQWCGVSSSISSADRLQRFTLARVHGMPDSSNSRIIRESDLTRGPGVNPVAMSRVAWRMLTFAARGDVDGSEGLEVTEDWRDEGDGSEGSLVVTEGSRDEGGVSEGSLVVMED